ncbi:hypothetical protein CRUP_001907 [Coryphaenoides rupestris]|nr:hypothetical protein CRUP_001907 [Coryphaenoides rupestris]
MLTWRDVQHIIVKTSQAEHLSAPDWHTNGAGYKVSHLYGFGMLDAEGMVTEAEGWREVSAHRVCEAEDGPVQLMSLHRPRQAHRRPVPALTVPVLKVAAACSGDPTEARGVRPLDVSTEGFRSWEFMTTHCWGEEAAGDWTLEPPYSTRRERPRSADMAAGGGAGGDGLTDEYSGPCDPECSDDGCEGPGPQQCVTCLHYFLKFKNNTRSCVSGCPAGFWGDRRRCKRCFPACASCTGSRSNQCVSCAPGYRLGEDTHASVTESVLCCGTVKKEKENFPRACSFMAVGGAGGGAGDGAEGGPGPEETEADTQRTCRSLQWREEVVVVVVVVESVLVLVERVVVVEEVVMEVVVERVVVVVGGEGGWWRMERVVWWRG